MRYEELMKKYLKLYREFEVLNIKKRRLEKENILLTTKIKKFRIKKESVAK